MKGSCFQTRYILVCAGSLRHVKDMWKQQILMGNWGWVCFIFFQAFQLFFSESNILFLGRWFRLGNWGTDGQEGSLAPHTPAQTRAGVVSPPEDDPPWGSPLTHDLRLEAKWPSHNFSVQSLDLSSHSWQKNSKKPQEERRHVLQGPVCVWDKGGDAQHPEAPSGCLQGWSQSSAGLHCSCASPGLQAQPSPPSRCQLLGRSQPGGRGVHEW